MPFSETLKAECRRRADMRCCLCHSIGIEIHHIVPEATGGADSFDNAAPLCPSCHETFGANPVKRKFIAEARDNWYRTCDAKVYSDSAALSAVFEFAAKGVRKADLDELKQELLDALASGRNQPASARDPRAELGDVLSFLCRCPLGANAVEADVDFLHFFVWGGSIGEEEDAIKSETSVLFGEVITRGLCRYVLRNHRYSLTKDGFTDEEIDTLVRRMLIDMVLLTHQEVVAKDPVHALSVTVTAGGDLRGALVQPANKRDGAPAA